MIGYRRRWKEAIFMVLCVLYVWWSDSRLLGSSVPAVATKEGTHEAPSSFNDDDNSNDDTSATSSRLTTWPFDNSNNATTTTARVVFLQLIHVGKAGGMSLRKSLCLAQRGQFLSACRRRQLSQPEGGNHPRRHWMEVCDTPPQPPHPDDTPMLVQRMFALQHMCCGHGGFDGSLNDDDQATPAASPLNLLVFTVRDPIDRIVSTFNYQHTMNFAGKPALPGEQHTLRTPRALVYLECFPTVQELADTVDPRRPSIDEETTCRAIGNQLLNGTFDHPKFDHFTYNYQSYVDRYWRLNSQQAVAVLRMEHQWKDVARLEGLLGGDSSRYSGVDSVTHVSHGSEGFALQGGVSSEGAVALCCAAVTELQAYQSLIVAAVNLRIDEKRYTLWALHVHCGRAASYQSNSWEELQTFAWASWSVHTCRPSP